MDGKNVELVAHHCCFCAHHPFKRIRASPRVIRRTTSRYYSADHRICPRHCAGSTSNLAACFRSFLLSFRESLYSAAQGLRELQGSTPVAYPLIGPGLMGALH